MLTADVQAAIDVASQQMLNHPNHSLLPKQRLPIFNAIGQYPFGQKVVGWLGFITAAKILPFWEKDMPNDDMAQRILEVAKGFLQETLTLEETKDDRELFYNAVGNAYDRIPSAAFHAVRAAYDAFKLAVGVKPFGSYSSQQIEEGFPDEIVAGGIIDPSSDTVLALSGFSTDSKEFEIKMWNQYAAIRENYEHNPLVEFVNPLEEPYDPNFDREKRREFWEWWLTEAIPQAWQLALDAAE